MLILIQTISAVRINEVELNPTGEDSGNEWIELYSSEEINLTGWKLINNDNNELLLNQTFQNYLIINFNGQWLDNSNESISLFNSSSLIDSSILLDDGANNNKTWQYCNGNWNFTDATKGFENSCEEQNGNANDDGDNQTSEIYLEMNWDEEDIINGEEFEIEVKAYNLENKDYDVRIWIEFEANDTVISDRYGEDDDGEEKWLSGKYYIYELFDGPGNETKKVDLRIRDDYEDFKGDAKIFFKIRDEIEIESYIEILEKKDEGQKDASQPEQTTEKIIGSEGNPSITGGVIRLGESKETEKSETEDKETNKNIIYESKTEIIKKYSIFGFALLCVALSILLVLNKLN